VKADAYDPEKIGEAYKSFINGDGFEDIAIELSIPRKVLAYHARKGDWLKRREDVLGVACSAADQEYVGFLAKERLPTARRHLRLARKLEETIEKNIDQLQEAVESGIIDDKILRRLTEAVASITAVSARAAGITDRPAPVTNQGQQGGKQPLIMIGITPTIAEGQEPTVDVTDYVHVHTEED